MPSVVNTIKPLTVGFNPKLDINCNKKYKEALEKHSTNFEFSVTRGGVDSDELMFFLDYPDLSIRTYDADFRTYIRIGLV